MSAIPIAFLVVPTVGLVAAVLLPAGWSNRNAGTVRRWATRLVGLQMLAAAIGAAALAAGDDAAKHAVILGGDRPTAVLASLYYDGVSSLIFGLVSFLGWIICRYSIRYLDGQQTQGRYYRWTAFTIGAVSLMVISGNMLMLTVAWVMTGIGLYQLLLHFPHRPEARSAAQCKFTISRLGDVALLGALALVYSHFGTFELPQMFAALSAAAEAGSSGQPAVLWAGWLLVIAAVTKSVQVPFHIWLPGTMETPTPVSALMHAGIVNAGGYLIIRLAPLVSQAPEALTTLAAVGAATACFGTVVMLTQSSVKRSLAYSTIAQMGFMMLQCGLGAFSAAVLHLVAHSLYKAHAFLSSGSILAQPAAASLTASAQGSGSYQRLGLAVSTIIVAAWYGIATFSVGLGLAAKPGGYLLGFVFCLAMARWLWQVFEISQRRVQLAGVAFVGLMSIAYALSFIAVDTIVHSSPFVPATLTSNWAVAVVVAIAFTALVALQGLLARNGYSGWLAAFYVHASNGFYVETVSRRFIRSVWSC